MEKRTAAGHFAAGADWQCTGRKFYGSGREGHHRVRRKPDYGGNRPDGPPDADAQRQLRDVPHHHAGSKARHDDVYVGRTGRKRGAAAVGKLHAARAAGNGARKSGDANQCNGRQGEAGAAFRAPQQRHAVSGHGRLVLRSQAGAYRRGRHGHLRGG